MIIRKPPPQRHHPALVELADARALFATAERVDAPPVFKLASRFSALTAVRFDSLRGARWSEIGDLDGEAPLWRVPAARMPKAVDRWTSSLRIRSWH